MRFTKRIAAICISIITMLAMMAAGVTAASFTDVPDDSTYKPAIDSLVALELLVGYEDGTFRPNATITRAEFAAVMTRAMGQEEVAKNVSSADIFTDMVVEGGKDHWATGYVRVAYNLGIIVGMGDNTFVPDAPVTYEQAVKMIVCALGYEQICIDRGGWPTGYLSIGNEIGVTKAAIMQPSSQPAPRGMVAKLLYNSLNLRIMEKTSSGNYSLTTKTILNSKLKVFELHNAMVVEVDGIASLNPGKSSLREGEMILESSNNESAKYKYSGLISSAEARNLLGYYVDCYYKYDEYLDERILVSIDASGYRNQSIKVFSDNVVGYSPSKRVLDYKENINDERTKELYISSDVKFIYNGAAFDYANSSNSPSMQNLSYWFSPTSSDFYNGEATFLDSGADGDVDVIFLYDFETFVVKEPVRTDSPVDANNYVVYDAYVSGKSVRLDPNDRSVNITILNAKDNSPMRVEYLQPYDILSVAESKSMDPKIITCYVSKERISGSVTEIYDNNRIYRINNTSYRLSPELRAAMSAGTVIIDLDSSGTFYLDCFGRIAAANVTTKQSGNYAYIAHVKDIGGVDGGLSITLMLPNSAQPVPYRTAEKVRVNGSIFTDTDLIKDALREAASKLISNSMPDASSTDYTQLIRYTVNSQNRIDSIITASTLSNGDLDIGPSDTLYSLKLGRQVTELTYSATNNFSNQVILNSDTKIFAVPNDRRQNGEYKILTASSFKVGKKYLIEPYNVKNGYANVIVVYGDIGSTGISEDTQVCLVQSVTQKTSTLHPDSGAVYSIKVYQSDRSGIVEYETIDNNPSQPYNQLKPGDIVRFGFNSIGQINDVKIALDCDNRIAREYHEQPYERGGYWFKTMYGTVLNKTDESMMITPALVDTSVEPPTLDTENYEVWNILPSTQFYMVEMQSPVNKITPLGSNSNNITDFNNYGAGASQIFAYMYTNELRMVVIYIDNAY